MERILGKTTLRKSKRGSLLDLIFIVIGVLVFASSVLIGAKITGAWSDKVATMDGMPAEAITSSSTLSSHYSGVVDHTFLLLVIGLSVGAFILASLVRVHPIFLPFFMIALVFVIFFAGVFSNVYQGMAENAALSSTADSLVFISNIMTYLPFIVGILGSVLALVMFKLWSNAQL
jgi:hypothetical protein